jgi:predicted exporter
MGAGIGTIGATYLTGAIADRMSFAPILIAASLVPLAGLAAVLLLFGGIHGIAIAFGITLLGVAVDYPLHLVSHSHGRRVMADALPRISRPLWLGCTTTMLAFASLMTAEITGLAQMGVFVVVGLAAAALTVQFVLPALLPRARGPRRLRTVIPLPPRPPAVFRPLLLATLPLAAAVLLWRGESMFETDLASFNPAPVALQELDGELRRDLGAASLRHFVLVEGSSEEAVLQAEERLMPVLDATRRESMLAGYELAARYMPSEARQRERQARLPDGEAVRQLVAQATSGLPYRRDAFEPFIEAVAATREQAPLSAADWLRRFGETPLAPLLTQLLEKREGRSFGFVTLTELTDPGAFASRLASIQGAPAELHLVDLEHLSADVMARFRNAALLRTGVGIVLTGLLLAVMLRRPVKVLQVLAVLAGAILVTTAVLVGCGVRLSLFHILSGLLVLGLGVDYAVFFLHDSDAQARDNATFHGVGVCALSTALVFGALSIAPFAILRAIGLPVLIGASLAFIFAYGLLARSRDLESDDHPRPAASIVP